MNDQEKVKRTLQILIALKNKYGVRIAQLSERFDVSQRTIYRYLETFKEIGFVLEKNNNYWKITSDNELDKDISELLHFSKEESYILQKAIHSIDENNQIKQNLVQKLYSLYNSRNIADTIIKYNSGENVRQLCDAIENKKQVILKDYKSASGATISDRKVEPFAFTTNYISLWCYDVQKKENRLFKTARIKHVKVLAGSWQYEHKHRQQEMDVFRMAGDKQTHITLDMSMRAANLLVEEYPLAEKHLTSIPHDRYRFQGMIHSFHGAGRFILGLMDEIKVIEPQELKDFLNTKIKRRKF